jgi:hypothetical protein
VTRAGVLLALMLMLCPHAGLAAEAGTGAQLRARIEAAARLPWRRTELPIRLAAGQKLGMVSGIARDRATGVTWILQRGADADPVIAVDRDGKVLHAFGRRLYRIPHAIRLGPDGNLWTVDAGNSRVLEFSPSGKLLLRIDASGRPSAADAFSGATDIAFADRRLFISDGYVHARILTYTAAGRWLSSWGAPGAGPGQFKLPHGIVADAGTLYVADRENGRIQAFTPGGTFLREIGDLGRVLAVQTGAGGKLWAAVAPSEEPPGAAGWLLELDGSTGHLEGYIPVDESPALHCLDLTAAGEPITAVGSQVIWFARDR